MVTDLKNYSDAKNYCSSMTGNFFNVAMKAQLMDLSGFHYTNVVRGKIYFYINKIPEKVVLYYPRTCCAEMRIIGVDKLLTLPQKHERYFEQNILNM